MNVPDSITIVTLVIDEVALEGLDGITLEALWQRLAIQLGESLPLKFPFMEQIWNICLKLHDFKFYELENPREKLIIFDRYELEYLNTNLDKEYEQKDIYLYCPIEDTSNGIRGSCSTYYTRKDISDQIKNLSLSEVRDNYGQKLVIVASQKLRDAALIESDVRTTIQLPLAHYCLLERIGRARRIGEISIKKSSSIKEDAKALFYIRKGLQRHGLIRKQVYYQGKTGSNYNGQNTGTLVHLNRFFNTRKPKVIIWAEHLINYLKSKENYVAEYNEVKSELNLDYSIKKFFKINLLQKVFRTDLKVPYRSYFPNSLEKEWQVKNNTTKERIIKLVTLTDPNIEISDLWRTEEVSDDDDQYQLDVKVQKLHVPFLKQCCAVLKSKEYKGASQTELATEMGLTKLISRTVVRNFVKAKTVSTYLDDIGRQRTTKFVSRQFDDKSSVKRQLEEEICKIKEYSRSIPINENIEEKLSNNTNNENSCQTIIENNSETEKSIDETNISIDENSNNNNCKGYLFKIANNIFKKYKTFKGKSRYRYTSSKKCKRLLEFKKLKKDINNKESIEKDNVNEQEEVLDKEDENIIDTDFYKTVQTKLIVQKPECKKKSQKMAVVGFMENVHNCDANKNLTISYRLLRRANLVIERVKEHKVIQDTQKLMKYINSEEDKEGLDAKIDKNSLIRLLQKLAEDNFIKCITLVLRNHTKQKIVNFICEPTIDVNDTVIQSAVEQAKLKFCMVETSLQKTIENTDNTSSTNNITKLPHEKKADEKLILLKDNRFGKKYGYSPKFIRMKTMHIFLYYLVYDHSAQLIPYNTFLGNLKREGFSCDDIFDNTMNVYSIDINWKMFISPLPKHRGYSSGWALMCDILLRMPLSIFVKVHNINFEVPGLQEFLDHPIKKYYLIKDMPSYIRNLLLANRKYMFSIHEVVTRLCYLGLVQFGPQMLKEKDQVFIYLNRHTELLDTTSSAAGYHRVEDKPYPVTKYTFTSMAVVETYWYEMWNTCINTCLGGRSVVEGKDILLEDLSRKSEMIQALKVRQVHEAAKYDIGFVPGDRKGAAGIDSAFFPHLKRNWNWVSTNQSAAVKKANSRPLQSVKTVKTSPRPTNIQARKTPQSRKRSNPPKPSQTKTISSSERRSSELGKTQVKVKREASLLQFPTVSCSKPPKIIRKVMPRKPMLRKRVKYDEIDYSALQRMDKLRVDWEQHEDNILLVCKVAMVYLCPNPRRNLVNFTAIRDILRSYSFKSYNKTSRACQRRLLYMLKQPKTLNSVLLGVEEVKQDCIVNKRFGGLVDSVRGESEDPMDYERRVEKVFKDLVTYIAKKYYNISNMEQREPEALPKSIQEFNLFYKLQLPTKTITTPRISKEVREVNDIHIASINSVIHSSMCCGKERRSWAYQLFKVYQQYPEYLLRSAMLKIRADQMVTMKKNYTSAFKKFGNCMPMSSSQYQLSSAYYYKFQTKWPYEIFSESFDILYSLLDNYAHRSENMFRGLEMKPSVGGVVATVHDFISTDKMNLDIDIPDQIIMLDPGLPEKDEVYQRIALRYETILKGLNSDFIGPSQGVTQNTVESSGISQDNLNNLDEASIINEKQSFVDIRSAKRPGEHDFNVPQAKKQKLDNETSLSTVETNNERNKSAIGNSKEEMQSTIEIVSVIENSCIIDDRDEKFLTLVERDNVSQQTSYKSISNHDVIEQIMPSVERLNTNNQTVSCKNLAVIKSNNTNFSSSTTQPADDNNKNEEPLVENASINIQPISNESSENNKDALESTNIVININKESESLTEDAGNGKKKCTSSSDTRASEPSKITFTRVSDLMRRVDSCIETEEVARVDVQDVRTRQTRIAMLKMREELHDLTFQDSHHAHEYFVVNSFKLFYSLTMRPEVKGFTDVTTYRGMDLPRKLLPIDIEVANKVLEDIKKFAVFPKYPLPYDDFKKEIMDDKIFEWGQVDSICKFVKAKAEFGATLHELVMNFGYLDNMLADILVLLSEKRIVLRAGIVTVRYIHYRYINPWIIHSYKILRLDKEAHQTVPEGSVYILDNEDNIDTEKDTKRVTTAANLFYSSPIKSSNNETIKRVFNSEKEPLPDSKELCASESTGTDTNVQIEVNEAATETKTSLDENNSQVEKAEDTDDNTKNPKRLRRNRTVLLKQKDIYRAAKLLDFNTAEEIKVVIKPWIRIDGVLNRRVLDRMLGAVLCYCIERPGACLTIIQNRFTPAIQPYHTRELIEILVKLGCIKTSVQKVPKVTLFSKPAKLVSTGNPDLVANSDSVIIEPIEQATLKFGMFLSNRSYSLDFLSSL